MPNYASAGRFNLVTVLIVKLENVESILMASLSVLCEANGMASTPLHYNIVGKWNNYLFVKTRGIRGAFRFSRGANNCQKSSLFC